MSKQASVLAWLKSHDLYVVNDITTDDDQSETPECYPVFYVRTEHDPSVGIFGDRLSDLFKSVDELVDWVEDNKEFLLERIEE